MTPENVYVSIKARDYAEKNGFKTTVDLLYRYWSDDEGTDFENQRMAQYDWDGNCIMIFTNGFLTSTEDGDES